MSEQIPGTTAQPPADNRTAIEHQAKALIQRAAAAGLLVAIVPSFKYPMFPSSLNVELTVHVWGKRS
jgi:hypothetical protein